MDLTLTEADGVDVLRSFTFIKFKKFKEVHNSMAAYRKDIEKFKERTPLKLFCVVE